MANRIFILVALEGADEGFKRAIISAERSLGACRPAPRRRVTRPLPGWPRSRAGVWAFGDQVAKAKTQLLAFLTLDWAAGKVPCWPGGHAAVAAE